MIKYRTSNINYIIPYFSFIYFFILIYIIIIIYYYY